MPALKTIVVVMVSTLVTMAAASKTNGAFPMQKSLADWAIGMANEEFGTKYCGSELDDDAVFENDGPSRFADKCCFEFAKCAPQLESGECMKPMEAFKNTKIAFASDGAQEKVCNSGTIPIHTCDCTQKFFDCLHKAVDETEGDLASRRVATYYFNYLHPNCFNPNVKTIQSFETHVQKHLRLGKWEIVKEHVEFIVPKIGEIIKSVFGVVKMIVPVFVSNEGNEGGELEDLFGGNIVNTQG